MRNFKVLYILFIFFFLSANTAHALEGEELKRKIAQLGTIISSLDQEKEQILEKLKIITKENSKLKAMIKYLQTGVLNMDEARKEMAENKEEMTGRITEMEREIQPVRSMKERYETKLKEVAEELSVYQSRAVSSEKRFLQLVGELKAAQEKVEFFSIGFEKEKKEAEQLKYNINVLEKEKKELLETKSQVLEDNIKIQRNFDNALSELSRANEDLNRLKRESADMHYNLGVIFQDAAKWKEAIMEYEKVLEIKPDDADTHFNLALIYDTLKNNRTKAIYHYEKYLKIKPDAGDALKVKGYITNLNNEDVVWGEPERKNIREKLGRW